MKASNGLPPVVNLNERQKCPTHPSKRRYAEVAEAWDKARKSSEISGLTIEPYLCVDCGFYHLTRSIKGDTKQLRKGKFSVGQFTPETHPVFSPPTEEGPILPGDHETRVRFLRDWLQSNPEPTSEQVMAAIGGCSRDTLRKVMNELGYRNTLGRSARWVRRPSEGHRDAEENEAQIDVPVIDRESGEPVSDPDPVEVRLRGGFEVFDRTTGKTKADDVPRGTSRRRREVNGDRIRHIPLGDLIDTYAACGLRLVLILEDDHA